MKANEKDRRKNGRQMPEENLKIPASRKRVESHFLGARQEVQAFDVIDRRQARDRVPIETQEPELLCRNQAQLLVV